MRIIDPLFSRPSSQQLHGVLRTRIWKAQSGGLLPGLVLDLGFDQHSHDVALFHYEVLDTIDFDLGARPFAEQNAVADLDVDRNELAALVAASGSNGDDLALLRLLLGGLGNDYAPGGLCLGIDSLDDDAVVKRSEFHWRPPNGFIEKSDDLESLSLFRKLVVSGPIFRDLLRSGGFIERLGHDSLDWLGNFSRYLLSERA